MVTNPLLFWWPNAAMSNDFVTEKKKQTKFASTFYDIIQSIHYCNRKALKNQS
jgi:hypothetical protein